ANARPPRSLDIVSFGVPFLFDRSRLSLSYLHLVLADGTPSDIVNASFSRSLFGGGSAYLTAFSDLDNKRNAGIFLGLSIPLDGRVSASAGVSQTRTGRNVTIDAVRSIQPETGDFGWRVRDSEGNVPFRLASGSYRSSVAQFDATVQQAGRNDLASMQA